MLDAIERIRHDRGEFHISNAITYMEIMLHVLVPHKSTRLQLLYHGITAGVFLIMSSSSNCRYSMCVILGDSTAINCVLEQKLSSGYLEPWWNAAVQGACGDERNLKYHLAIRNEFFDQAKCIACCEKSWTTEPTVTTESDTEPSLNVWVVVMTCTWWKTTWSAWGPAMKKWHLYHFDESPITNVPVRDLLVELRQYHTMTCFQIHHSNLPFLVYIETNHSAVGMYERHHSSSAARDPDAHESLETNLSSHCI